MYRSMFYILAKKLKLLKKDIKVWNKEVLGRVKVEDELGLGT